MEERVKELLSSGGKNSGAFDEQLSTSCRQFFTQSVEFHAARRPDSYLAYLQANYKPLNRVNTPGDKMESMDVDPSSGDIGVKAKQVHLAEEGFPHPKQVLFSPERVEVAWKHVRGVGAGLCNMGNTCFLNSVLQCLCHTPPLYNYIMSGEHKQTCSTQGFCSMCEFHRHCTRAMSGNTIIKPFPIVQNLKAIAKQFRVGRQEDAHEFLRYFVDGLQKSCLQAHHQKLDPHSKATTVVHQIFGGYHRSQVKCLSCKKTSNTFDPLLDVSLDIKNATSLHKALHKFVKPDHLDGENKYACPFCHEMTKAQKKLTIHRLPNVLTVQLKRFDYNSMFGGKVGKPVSYPEHLDMCPFTSDPHGPPSWYSLYGVLVHFGFSCHSGHYYCYVKSANGVWHCMNDSSVTQVSKQTALNQEAYLLFYIKNNGYQPPCRPEGRTETAGKSSLATIKPDPNFLGTPVKRPGVDKAGVPLVRHVRKPTGVVTPSRQTTPTREFSIPLRKADTAALLKGKKAEATSMLSTGISPPKATPAPQPSFIPRVIAAPKKLKKTPAHAGNAAQPGEEAETMEDKKDEAVPMEVSSDLGTAPPPSPSGGEQEMDTTGDGEEKGALPDVGEMRIDQSEETLSVTCNSDLHHDTPAAGEGKFIGPVLPPRLRALSPFTSPHLNPSTASPTKVARVHPQPHVTKKPVARVLPSPHIQPPKSDTETVADKAVSGTGKPEKEEKAKGQPKPPEASSKGGQKDEEEVSSQTGDGVISKKGGKDSELAKADSTTHPDDDRHHLISRSEWMVSEPQPGQVFGPSLPEDYDNIAHGWTVTAMKSDSSKIFRVRSKKTKNRKYRSRSFGDSSESDQETEKGDAAGDKDRLKSPAELKDNRVSSTDDIQRSKSESGFKTPKPKVRDRIHSWSNHHPHSTCEDRAKDKKHTRHYSEGEERKDSKDEHHYRPSDSSPHSLERHKHRHHGSERSDWKARHRHNSYGSYDSSRGHPYRDWHRQRPTHWDPRYRRRDLTLKFHQHQHNLNYRHRSTYSSGDEGGEGRGRKNRDHRARQTSPEKGRHHKHEDRNIPGDPTRSDGALQDSKGEKRDHATSRHREAGDGGDGRTVGPSPTDQHEKSSADHPPSHGTHSHRAKAKTPVPEVEWDASLKTKGEHGGRGDHSHSKWDGSQRSETVDELTSQSHDKLGDVVKSWDGGENTVDSSRVGGEGYKRARDTWDEEIDRGRVKKCKEDRRREKDDRASAARIHQNPFQDFHDRKHKFHHRNHYGKSHHSPHYRRR